MKPTFKALALATAASFTTLAPAQAQDLTPINLSYQPALYWALPFYLATEFGWWAEVGLDPSFTTFPAGAPQIAAAQANDWDVGGTGSVPAVLGAARFGLVTVGITNDESAGNALMARNSAIEGFRADPSSMAGQRILLTTNSTVDFATQQCLEMMGVPLDSIEFVNLGQAQVITGIIAGEANLAGVWAPNTYTLQERADSDYLCSGADAGAIVPGALVVRPGFAEESPELVARVLAAFLRGVAWSKANPEEARRHLVDFYSDGGIEISDAAVNAEFDLRPTFTLEEQIALMDRSNGLSEFDQWLTAIGDFMTSVGTTDSTPATEDFINPSFMQMVMDDPELRAFANNE
jgi:ABC-type nitrate/sulfonate/bicarbonate transport system substrate-binding protein